MHVPISCSINETRDGGHFNFSSWQSPAEGMSSDFRMVLSEIGKIQSLGWHIISFVVYSVFYVDFFASFVDEIFCPVAN